MAEIGKQANTANPNQQFSKTGSNNFSSSDDITVRGDINLRWITGNKPTAGTFSLSVVKGSEVTPILNQTGSNTDFALDLEEGFPLQDGDILRPVSTGTGDKYFTLRWE